MNYDLWIESSTPPFTFSFLPLFCKKPVIIWINMLCSIDMQRKYKLNFSVFERALSKFYHYVITPTEWVKKEIASMNDQAKIYTISQGFDLEFRDDDLKRIPGLGNYLLYMGRIEVNQKGLDLLLQAMHFTGSKTQLVIAGSGSKDEENKLTELIAQYGVVRKVKRIGRVQGKEKEILLKYAKGVVIPSRFETFSITALESIMHQKPVICFDIPQLKWIPGEYAVKIKPYSMKHLARGIDSLFSKDVKKRISSNEREEFLKKFSWSNTAAKFESVFRTLL
jgi:glycosyltransferase involved in cell wall biosynthesis